MSLSPAPALLALAAGLAYALALVPGQSRERLGATALTFGWTLHAAMWALDIAPTGLGGAARLGFAGVLSITVWLVLAVHAVESRFVPLPSVRRVLALCGLAAVALAWAFAGEPRLPSASPWAPLHWVLGVASYGLFGAAVLHARWLDLAEKRLRGTAPAAHTPAQDRAHSGMPLLRLERLTFRFIEAGFVVLSAALALGVATAAPWRWHHKAVFSSLAWLVFAALLCGRHWRGWRGRRATRWLYVGAVLLLLAYAGSRFVFEVLLGRAASGA